MDYTDWTTPSYLEDIENDPFFDSNGNDERERNIRDFYSVLENVVSSAHLLIGVVILLASSIFFYSICKFKRLQTRTNYILLHFLISITLASLCCALMLFLNMLSISHGFTSDFLFTIGPTFMSASLIFAFLLAQDWILSVSNARKYQTYYKWMIGVVYVFIGLDLSLEFIGALRIDPLLIIILIYIVFAIVIAIFNIVRCRKQVSDESKQVLYALKVASVYFLMLLPIVICILNIFLRIDRLLRSKQILEAALVCLSYVLELIAFSAPVVIICLLPKWNEDFKIAYESMFKKSNIDEVNNLDNV